MLSARARLRSIAAALVVGVCYLVFNHWTTNNIFGLAFSIQVPRPPRTAWPAVRKPGDTCVRCTVGH